MCNHNLYYATLLTDYAVDYRRCRRTSARSARSCPVTITVTCSISRTIATALVIRVRTATSIIGILIVRIRRRFFFFFHGLLLFLLGVTCRGRQCARKEVFVICIGTRRTRQSAATITNWLLYHSAWRCKWCILHALQRLLHCIYPYRPCHARATVAHDSIIVVSYPHADC